MKIKWIEIAFRATIAFAIAGCGPAGPPSTSVKTQHSSNESVTLPIYEKISLGVLEQGEMAQFTLWLTNRGDKDVNVATIEKSCDCIDLHMPRNQISPGERVLARVRYNGEESPGFVGSLLIEITLSNDSGIRVGECHVSVEVLSNLPTF